MMLTYIASYIDPFMAYGWAGAFFVGLAATCVLMFVVSLLAIAIRYFKPLPPRMQAAPSGDVIRAPEQPHALDIGEFGRVSFQTIFQPSPWPNDVQGNREFVAVAVRFTYKVTTNKPKIRVTVTRRRNVRFELDPSLVDEYAWYAKIDDRIWHERDTVDISLAYVGKDMHNHGFTGDWAIPPTIMQNNQYLFLVEILSAERSQSLRVYMSIPSLSDGPQLSHPHIYNGNLFYLQDDRYSPFTDGRFDPSSNDAPMVRAGGGWGSAPWGT